VKSDIHRAKAERIQQSLSRLSPSEFEAIIEGAMLAATHWFHVILHERGLQADTVDVMHAEFLSVGVRRKVALQARVPMEALDEIEHFRTTHVRGDLPDGEKAAARALVCLKVLEGEARSHFAEQSRSTALS
jgi:hypothetical protein